MYSHIFFDIWDLSLVFWCLLLCLFVCCFIIEFLPCFLVCIRWNLKMVLQFDFKLLDLVSVCTWTLMFRFLYRESLMIVIFVMFHSVWWWFCYVWMHLWYWYSDCMNFSVTFWWLPLLNLISVHNSLWGHCGYYSGWSCLVLKYFVFLQIGIWMKEREM